MDSITIILPYPDKRLNAHHKTNRWKVREATKRARHSACALGLEAIGRNPKPLWGRAEITMRFWFPQNNRQDIINFAQMTKAGFDGIVDCGILKDENHTVVGDVHLHFAGYDKQNPRVEVTIKPL